MARYRVQVMNGSTFLEPLNGGALIRLDPEKFQGGERWSALRDGNILEDGDGRGTYKLREIVPPPPGSTSGSPDIDRNPYNFVRLAAQKPWLEEANPKQGKHAGHKVWNPSLLHGHIDLTLIALNPVFFPAWVARSGDSDDADENDDNPSRQFYTLRKREAEGHVCHCAIPGSSLKGVLRSMVEALSNDRFGAIGDPTIYALKMPYRRRAYQLGKAIKENGKWYVYPLPSRGRGTYPSGLLWLDATHRGREFESALREKVLLPEPVIATYNSNLEHPHFQRHLKIAWTKRRPRYANGALAKFLGVNPNANWDSLGFSADTVRTKIVEHLSFPSQGNGPVEIYFTHRDGRVDSFGRNVNYLWPSLWSVADLCGDWFPPTKELSLPNNPQRGLKMPLGLAERMFGFAADHNERKGSHPLRGKLRFEPVWGPRKDSDATEEVRGLAKTMAPESRAKCRPLYLVGRVAENDKLHSTSYCDVEEPVFRGRKFYWKQKPPNGEEVWSGHIEKPEAESGIHALPAKTEFTTRIHFDNLSEPELGALLHALLGIDWQHQPTTDEVTSGSHAIHIGKFKPRGFGACKVRIDSLCLRSPSDEYSSLTEVETPRKCSSEDIGEYREAFRKWCLEWAHASGDSTEKFEQLDYICDFSKLHKFPEVASVRYYPQNWSQYSWTPRPKRNPGDPDLSERPIAMNRAKDLNP